MAENEINAYRYVALTISSLVIFTAMLFSTSIVIGFAGWLAGTLWFGAIFLLILFAERIIKRGK